MDLDDHDALVETPSVPDLSWVDESFGSRTWEALNQMRKNKHFCDVILQIGKQDIPAHRAVLAAASPYLFELFTSEEDQPTQKEEGIGILYQLNGGFDKDALDRLVDYAYTARLEVSSDKVTAVYKAAIRLKMDSAIEECAKFLSNHLVLSSCLYTRSLTGGTGGNSELLSKIDRFIADNLKELRHSRELNALPRICLEVLHNSKDDLDATLIPNLCQLCLTWIHQQWDEDENLTLESLTSKPFLLFLANDNTLQDCDLIEEGSIIQSDRIQDYKKVSQQHQTKTKKVRRKYIAKPSKPRELLYTRNINQDEVHLTERSEDFKVIASTDLEDDKRSVLAVVTVNRRLFTLSIMQRVNTPTRASSDTNLSPLSNAVSPKISRPPSVERDDFSPVAAMDEAKCAVGGACLDGKLIVCGGYDRGECLNSVSLYDPKRNCWCPLEPMLTKRGRFDITICDGDVYAVGGSNGTTELSSVEKLDRKTRKWSFIRSLPTALCNVGVCNLDGGVYCIGGLLGQSGTRGCYRLNGDEWEAIASLNVGRSQAAVCAFQGRIWVVGGCDTWNPLNTVEIYDPKNDEWSFGPPMASPRRGCGLTPRKGLLYVIGGSDGTHSLCTTEILDPEVGAWRPGTNMTMCRTNVSTALVGDDVWAVGGFSGKMFLNTLEFFDGHEWTSFVSSPQRSILKEEDSEENGKFIETNGQN